MLEFIKVICSTSSGLFKRKLVLPVAFFAKITSKECLLIGFVLPLLWAGSEAPLASSGMLL